jgi:hypothetical protein
MAKVGNRVGDHGAFELTGSVQMWAADAANRKSPRIEVAVLLGCEAAFSFPGLVHRKLHNNALLFALASSLAA